MRTKDSYQEHMLGYLVGVQIEIERLERSRQIRRSELIEVYECLDSALEYLWWVISSSDTEWEPLRFNLEARCDDLLQGYDRALRHFPRSKARWS